MPSTISQIFSHALTPLGILWGFLLGFTFLLARRRRWLESGLCLTAAAGLWVLGATPLSAVLLNEIERSYRTNNPSNIPPADAVIMLGGIMAPSPSDSRGFNLGPSADRLFTAIDIARSGKVKALILGGGSIEEPERSFRESQRCKALLTRWGVVPIPIYDLPGCRDTRDEAIQVAALAKTNNWRKFVLVSSANHLRRASATFRSLGLDVAPIGCDFDAESVLQSPRRFVLIPQVERLNLFQAWIHETVGWFYYRLRGWI